MGKRDCQSKDIKRCSFSKFHDGKVVFGQRARGQRKKKREKIFPSLLSEIFVSIFPEKIQGVFFYIPHFVLLTFSFLFFFADSSTTTLVGVVKNSSRVWKENEVGNT